MSQELKARGLQMTNPADLSGQCGHWTTDSQHSLTVFHWTTGLCKLSVLWERFSTKPGQRICIKVLRTRVNKGELLQFSNNKASLLSRHSMFI